MLARQSMSGMKTFMLMWLGQTVSQFGSALTGFAFGVWIFQTTGSVTQFGLGYFFGTFPGIVLAPLGGAVVDRWDRRKTMIYSNIAAGIVSLIVAILFMNGQLGLWHIYVAVAVSSVFKAVQGSAYTASTSLLVPKKHLGRASGMTQGGFAIASIAAPMMAGYLVDLIKIEGILFIDAITFLFAIVSMLLFIRIPKPEVSAAGAVAKGSLFREAAYGWTYMAARPGLMGLLIFSTITNMSMGLVEVLLTPLVLSFATAEELGTVLATGAVGMLAGSLAISIWGGPKRRIYGVLGFVALQGLLLLLSGLQPNLLLVAIVTFAFLFTVPIVAGCNQAIWQTKVDLDLQGRVFAMRRLLTWALVPLTYLTSGTLVEYVFDPLIAENGPLASSVGQLIGVGPGRGIGLLFILIGILTVLASLLGYLYSPLRHVEQLLPDVIKDTPPAQAAAVDQPGDAHLTLEPSHD